MARTVISIDPADQFAVDEYRATDGGHGMIGVSRSAADSVYTADMRIELGGFSSSDDELIELYDRFAAAVGELRQTAVDRKAEREELEAFRSARRRERGEEEPPAADPEDAGLPAFMEPDAELEGALA